MGAGAEAGSRGWAWWYKGLGLGRGWEHGLGAGTEAACWGLSPAGAGPAAGAWW